MAGRLATVRLGLAGLGQLAREVHIPLLRKLPYVQIDAIADPDQRAIARGQALMPEAKAYSSLSAMLQQSDVDGVLVASPTGEHARHACEVLKAKKALYLEKPLGATLSEGELVLDTAAATGGRAMMGFNYRFHPLALRIRQQLHNASVPIHHGRSVFTIAPRPLPEWKQKRISGGGVLLDLATHHFDLLRFLLDAEITRVWARLWSERTEDDCCELTLQFSNGARIDGLYSFCRAEQDEIELNAPGRHLLLNRYAPLRYPLWPPGHFFHYQWERRESPWKEVSFRRSLSAWIESIRGDAAPPVTLSDGMKALRAVAAAEESARCGAPVSLAKEPLAAGGAH